MIRSLLALSLAASASAAPALAAPNAEETAVLAAAQRLFDAMAAPDAAAVQAAVLPGSMFTAVRARPDGTRQLSRVTVEQFAANRVPASSSTCGRRSSACAAT